MLDRGRSHHFGAPVDFAEQQGHPADLSQKVWNWIEADQLSDKLVVALEQNSPAGEAAGHRSRQSLQAARVDGGALEDGGRHVVHELERFLNTLGTIASSRRLLGLLGTVAGIIHAFNAITANGLGDPRTLSGGIGEALITTAAGLTVAIPSLDRLSISARQSGTVGHSHGKGSHEVGRCPGRTQQSGQSGPPMNLRPRHREDPEINLISLIDVLVGAADFLHGLHHLQSRRAGQGSAAAG
jgi:biopolymer transport protein ExbB/TolQ